MGLKKRQEFDHSQESVFDAAGYSEETVTQELEPRAMVLADQLVHVTLTYPMMAIEVLLDSPVLKDGSLDNRDVAVIVMMTGQFLASAYLQQLTDGPRLHGSDAGKYGFNHRVPGEPREVLKMSKVEWDSLVHHLERRVFGNGHRKISEHIERMQEVLDDRALSPLQKAVVEVLALKASIMDNRTGPDSTSSVSLLS